MSGKPSAGGSGAADRPGNLLHHEIQDDTDARLELSVSINGLSIHVTESTPMPLLAEVLKVVRDAE